MRKFAAHTTRRRLALAAVACGAAIAAAQGPPPQPVAVAEVVERDIPPSIRLVGTILPERSAVIAAEVSGVVAEFIASEGDFLHTGDPICKLDDAVARLELAAAEARLGELQAKLTELENGTRPETLRQLEAAVGEAKAIYEMWRFERQRIEELYKQNQSSAKERNDTEQEFRAAERRFAQRTAAYEEARNGPRTEAIDAARFEVAAQQAVVARLRRDLEKTVIRAPFDGFVTRKRTEVGQWLASGGPAAEMVAIDTVRIRADVPEEAAPFARTGAPASIEVRALRRTINAAVSRIIPQADAAARTFPAEVDVANPEHELWPGMFVWAHLPSGPPGKRLMASKDAIVARGLERLVYVIREMPDAGAMAMPLNVETGLELDGMVEVRAKGLRAGDRVVIRANERLHGPSPVMVLPPAGAPPASAPSDATSPAPAGAPVTGDRRTAADEQAGEP